MSLAGFNKILLVSAAMLLAAWSSMSAQGPPPASPSPRPQRAGMVVNSIPNDDVEREGSATPLPITVRDPVFWNDDLHTLDNGRLRVRLIGGSFLTIGARSSMRVVQHDPASQQTVIELEAGQFRGNIVKLTQPGSSFEIRTPTSVIGVVGTILDITATKDSTIVKVRQGKVKVRNRNSKAKGEKTVKEGEATQVDRDKEPEKPKPIAEFEKSKRKEAAKQARKEKSQNRKMGNKTGRKKRSS